MDYTLQAPPPAQGCPTKSQKSGIRCMGCILSKIHDVSAPVLAVILRPSTLFIKYSTISGQNKKNWAKVIFPMYAWLRTSKQFLSLVYCQSMFQMQENMNILWRSQTINTCTLETLPWQTCKNIGRIIIYYPYAKLFYFFSVVLPMYHCQWTEIL